MWPRKPRNATERKKKKKDYYVYDDREEPLIKLAAKSSSLQQQQSPQQRQQQPPRSTTTSFSPDFPCRYGYDEEEDVAARGGQAFMHYFNSLAGCGRRRFCCG